MTMVTLRVLDGTDRGRIYEDVPAPLTIGREEGNSIQLNDERVSRFHVKIQEDAIASIKTKGLIGEKYIEITAGGSEKILEPGDLIRETEPAVDLEQLISNYVFGKL